MTIFEVPMPKLYVATTKDLKMIKLSLAEEKNPISFSDIWRKNTNMNKHRIRDGLNYLIDDNSVGVVKRQDRVNNRYYLKTKLSKVIQKEKTDGVLKNDTKINQEIDELQEISFDKSNIVPQTDSLYTSDILLDEEASDSLDLSGIHLLDKEDLK